MRQQIFPGDLVYGIDSNVPQGSVSTKAGLVLAVRYPRQGHHIGCEKRISVLWMAALRIKEECDCALVLPSQFVPDTVETCGTRGSANTG